MLLSIYESKNKKIFSNFHSEIIENMYEVSAPKFKTNFQLETESSIYVVKLYTNFVKALSEISVFFSEKLGLTSIVWAGRWYFFHGK
jgi:hypothetical protein